MELLHKPPLPTIHTHLHFLLSPDWSSPAIADVRRVFLWTSPRVTASILPPLSGWKTPEEEKKCARCQAPVRCSFDGGQPGLFCSSGQEFSSTTPGTNISISWITEKRREGCSDKFPNTVIKVRLVRLSDVCMDTMCVRVCVRGRVLCMVQWSRS